MRKIIASEFMTIDGVIQNKEDDADGFKYGEKERISYALFVIEKNRRKQNHENTNFNR
jgi:hypothetical protein